ncbi:hypothetical protein [Vibrio sp. HN007]|uniref:hypothetical protein n=1 Tax=Vibrio iocasae TaxID=3098914 RepID=UPI0035D49F33
MKTKWLFNLLIAGFVSIVSCHTASNTLALTIQKKPDSPSDKYLKSLYSGIFDKLGVEIRFQHYPHKRANQRLIHGDVDGDTSRVYEYGEWFPELIRVREPHYLGHVLAVTTDPDIDVSSLKKIQDGDYDICYHRGSLIVERKISELFDQSHFRAVSSTTFGLRTLNAKRCDLFIGVDNELIGLLASDEFVGEKFYIRNSLYSYSAHMYLLPKYKELAENVSQELVEMRETGQLEQLQQQNGLNFYKSAKVE